MSNFSPDDIKKLLIVKDKECYYGEIVLYLRAGKVPRYELRQIKKAGEGQPVAQGATDGTLHI